MRGPVLKYPDFTKPFVLTTDTSVFAVGAILSQGMIGQCKPLVEFKSGRKKLLCYRKGTDSYCVGMQIY